MCNKSFFSPAIFNCFGISGQYIFWHNPLKGFCSAFMVLNKVETGSQDITILQITNDNCRKGVDQPNGPHNMWVLASRTCHTKPYSSAYLLCMALMHMHGDSGSSPFAEREHLVTHIRFRSGFFKIKLLMKVEFDKVGFVEKYKRMSLTKW